ncbi:MAG: polyprenyl synthetase family protein [Candidatus Omnitrophica bacterium]|nr:polyprenyl synthetase family protein [Candidatus Omnitrophota bacterium]
MPDKIKKKVELELKKFATDIDKTYSLSKISPLLFKSIKDFILRKGKRIRPILFVVGYSGFSKKLPAGLYRSALAIELMHDFMLVHDDIIDKSDTRRGKPSMHKLLDKYLKNYKKVKFSGQDLSIVIGDVMYAIAIKAFLAIREDPERKEKALKKFIEAAIYTGSGEFIELLGGIDSIEKITKDNIYRIYDYKTACYTFSTPLASGAILAGAPKKEIDKLFKFGIFLGRAFQIRDDILGMFGDEQKIGKSTLSDLQESKKTLLIWQAYQNSSKAVRMSIKRLLAKSKVSQNDLVKVRRIITESGALDYAEREINSLVKRSQALINSSSISGNYKDFLIKYPEKLLKS